MRPVGILPRGAPTSGRGRDRRAAPTSTARLALWVLGYLAVLLALARHSDRTGELLLGALTWLALLLACRPLAAAIRARVAGVVLVASCGEVLGSLVLGLYAYRLGGIPLFVPPGHGLVYVAGHCLARSTLMRRRPPWTLAAALLGAVGWGIAGLVLGPRADVAGALAMLAVLAFLLRGRDPALFAAMLVVVAALELYGTRLGVWTWAAAWPLVGLPAGNPPSGVAAGYFVFDAVALRWEPWLRRAGARLGGAGAAIAGVPARSSAALRRLATAASAHLTVSLPSMPPSRWPGTEQ